MFLDPAAELGDVVQLLGSSLPLIMYGADIRLGADITADIWCPGDGEMEHEFACEGPYSRALANTVSIGEVYEGVSISRGDGIIVRSSDGSAEVQFKSGSIAMRALIGGVMKDVLYFDGAKRTYVFDGELSAGALNATQALFTPELYVTNLYAAAGAIADLVVNRLRTDWDKPFKYLAGDSSDVYYLDIHNECIKFIEAKHRYSSMQYTNVDGLPLYWFSRDYPLDIQAGMTTDPYEVTPPGPDGSGGSVTPRNQVEITNYEERDVGGFAFEPVVFNGQTYQTPVLTLGRGDPGGRMKARIYKNERALRIEYDHSGGATYYLEIGEDGIKTNQPITVDAPP
ncbi:MAG: hypothetical protein FWH06_02475 [Oscillospiraceae bacterium]|nr:hypothetical protein [Oscillospiraceae bacterium]